MYPKTIVRAKPSRNRSAAGHATTPAIEEIVQHPRHNPVVEQGVNVSKPIYRTKPERAVLPPIRIREAKASMTQVRASTEKTFFSKGKGKMFVDKVNCYSKLENSGNTINIFAGISDAELWKSHEGWQAAKGVDLQMKQLKPCGRDDEQ